MPTARSDDDVPPLLRGARVHDVMHAGVLSCPAGTSVRDAARLMALSHVHCVVVEQAAPRGGERDWVLLSDVDVLAALVDGDEDAPAAARAGAAPLTVGAEEPLSGPRGSWPSTGRATCSSSRRARGGPRACSRRSTWRRWPGAGTPERAPRPGLSGRRRTR